MDLGQTTSSLLKRLAALFGNERGSLALNAAVAAPALLAVIGVAIDFGHQSLKTTTLQAAVDQAAIAAAKEMALSNSNADSINAVAKSYVMAQITDTNSTIEVEADVSDDRTTVKVTAREAWVPFFAHFIRQDITPVVTHATAQLAGTANICVLALEGFGTKAIHLDKQAKLTANECGVYSNSKHTQGIRLDQNSAMHAALICSAGGVKAKTGAVQPTPTTDCPQISDPLINRIQPSPGPCDEMDLVIDTGVLELKPGHYCGGLRMTGDAKVTLVPGDYVISDGNFEVSGKAQLKGDHAAVFLSGEKAMLKFVGDSQIAMTGAHDGPMAGLLFFEDRSVTKERKHELTSSGISELTGTIYLPRGNLEVSPNASVAGASDFTAIVANRVLLNEGPELILNSNYGASDVPVPDGIRTSAQVVLID